MYLRWSRYVGKGGTVRFYGRLVECCRVNGKPRQRQVGSLRLVLVDGPTTLTPSEARDLWRHVDYVLSRYRSTPAEQTRIEAALSKKLSRPEPTVAERNTMALLEAIQRYQADKGE
jgi:hypothetical protein